MRGTKNPSHSFSPLYKGVSEENVRGKPKTAQHITKTSKRIDFAMSRWQNRGCVYNYIYLRVVEMPCTSVNDA